MSGQDSADWKEPYPAPDATSAALVLDAVDQPGIPRLVPFAPTASGHNLTASGSGQFSERGWLALLAQLPLHDANRLVVVDLRKESHGYLNGAAVSWYASRNWGSAGLDIEDALRLERLRLTLLGDARHARVSSKAAVVAHSPVFEEWPVERVTSEQEVVESRGARYVRIPVNDHCRPDDLAVQMLSTLFATVAAGSHLHFHCRGGKGRTSTALAMLDMFLNAGSASLGDIIAQQRLHTAYGLDPSGMTDDSFKAPLRRDRWAMLEAFYREQRARIHATRHKPGIR